jgi:hypothetical protein
MLHANASPDGTAAIRRLESAGLQLGRAAAKAARLAAPVTDETLANTALAGALVDQLIRAELLRNDERPAAIDVLSA